MLPNKVYSFDHVAINDKVIACEWRTPRSDDCNTGRGGVFVFADGAELRGLFERGAPHVEIRRILEDCGTYQPLGGQTGRIAFAIAEAGFVIAGNVVESNQFLYIDAIKTDR